MDDIQNEKLIPLPQVPHLQWLARRPDGTSVHLATLYRWVTHGRRGVKLRAVRTNLGLATSETWLRDFFSDLAVGQVDPSDFRRSPAERTRAFQRAEQELDEAGIGADIPSQP